MRTLNYNFEADTALRRSAHVGVVASGDLEILVDSEPHGNAARVRVRTSVDGFDAAWEKVLRRFFSRERLMGRWEINDFGATPAVVSLRLQQAAEAATRGESQ
ncbi:malonate decarboxylase acyl carrier protein [Mycobacterium sp. 050134]|uniref:malonate decarboxylase acyl carrier protein n=1 Tax=Mycobacterium sp. 050134 TaxID=3096111 RepID=UPI002EDB82F6